MTGRLLLLALVVAAPAAAQPRDADCSGGVDERDRAAVVATLFGAPSTCPNADINRNGRADAADLIAFARGPHIVFIGIASPDGQPAPLLGTLPDGAPVYFRSSGSGFLLVVEVAPPPSGAQIGTKIFDLADGDPSRRPDLQPAADRPLGNGSRAICDEFGIPGHDPIDFTSLTQPVANAINDFACRFDVVTRANSACTQNRFGQLSFVSPHTRAQFCLPVTSGMAFPAGDTRVAVQVRDQSGLLGPVQEMVMRVGSGPFPPTFTPLPPTATPTGTDTPSPSPTVTATRTPSSTRSVTHTRTLTRTPTRTQTAAPSPSRTRTATRTATPVPGTPTNTATGSRPAATATPSPSRTSTRTQTPLPTTAGPSPTRTRTSTPAGSPTRTATRTRTATATNTSGPSPTRTRTATIAPTATATPNANGPIITHFGLTRADDMLLPAAGTENGIPVYRPAFGFAFSLVVEARPGPTGARVGNSTFSPGAPDLQIQVTRPLGNASPLVCDDAPPTLGGVPAINPPNFADQGQIVDVINDLACRFIDGSGQKVGRVCGDANACVLGPDGLFGCVSRDASIQFCGFIGQALTFPRGDTLVTVRVRDVRGNVSANRQLIVRVP